MPSEIIAEFSSNWGGKREVLSRMLDEAVVAKVDWVKTQSHSIQHLNPDDPQWAWMMQAEMLDTDHTWFQRQCAMRGMKWLTTPFHPSRVPFLADLGLEAIKVGSGEASDPVMLEVIAKYPWKVYLSTGLMTAQDFLRTLTILHDREVVLMHTVSEYPTPTRKVNLGRMEWLADQFGLPVGYSDHTTGLHAALAAIARGAAAVEVHFAAQGDVPRRNVWDKDRDDLSTLVLFRDAMEQMLAPGRMLWHNGEERPYVNRWRYAAH